MRQVLTNIARAMFGTVRRATVTLLVLAAIILMFAPGVWDRFVDSVLAPALGILLPIGILLVAFRFVLFGPPKKPKRDGNR